MQGKRARKEEDKQTRRDAIQDAAAYLLGTVAWTRFSVGDVATRAGLSKPTVFLYYPTREALMLGLLERELGAWLDHFQARLARGGRWSPARVAREAVDTLDGRVPLLRLLAQLEGVLEHNVPMEHARRFKTWLGVRLVEGGRALESRLEFLPAGGGVDVLLRIRALVTGVWLMADASPMVDQLLQEPALAHMRVDFRRTLEPSLTALLLGMQLEQDRAQQGP